MTILGKLLGLGRVAQGAQMSAVAHEPNRRQFLIAGLTAVLGITACKPPTAETVRALNAAPSDTAKETIELLKTNSLPEIANIKHSIKRENPKFYFVQVNHTYPIPETSTEERDKKCQEQVYKTLKQLGAQELQDSALYVDRLDKEGMLELKRQLSYYSHRLPESTISDASLVQDQTEFAARALAAEGQYKVKAAAEDSYKDTLLSAYVNEGILSNAEVENFSELRQALELSKLIEPAEKLGAAAAHLPFMILGIRLGLTDAKKMMGSLGRDLNSLPAYLRDLAQIQEAPPRDLEAAIVKAHNSQRTERQTKLLERITDSDDRVNIGLFTPDVDFTAVINKWNSEHPNKQIDYLSMMPRAIAETNYPAANIEIFAKEAADVVDRYRMFACEYIKSLLLRSPLGNPPQPKPAPRILLPGALVVNPCPELRLAA